MSERVSDERLHAIVVSEGDWPRAEDVLAMARELAKYREDEADLAACAKKVDAWAAEHGGMLEAVQAKIADEDAARVAQARREACEEIAARMEHNARHAPTPEYRPVWADAAAIARRIGEGR